MQTSALVCSVTMGMCDNSSGHVFSQQSVLKSYLSALKLAGFGITFFCSLVKFKSTHSLNQVSK